MMSRRFKFIFVFCGLLPLVSLSCIDLNDFDRISKNVEIEVSMPVFDTKFYLDSFLKQSASFLKTNTVGVYYLEQQTNSFNFKFPSFPFDYTMTYQRIQFGPFFTITDRLNVQQDLYDKGETVYGYTSPINITSFSPDIQLQIRTIQIVKGSLFIDIENTFAKAATVDVTYNSLISLTTGLVLHETFIIQPLTREQHVVDISGFFLDMSKGNVGYNQMEANTIIRVSDPSAVGNATNSAIGSLNRVSVLNTMRLDSAINLSGALPNLILASSIPVKIDVPPLENTNAFGSAVDIMGSVLALEVSTNVEAPLTIKIEGLTANFVDGTSRSIVSKNPDYLFEISSPSATDGDAVTNKIIIDNSVIDEDLLRETIYNPDILNISFTASAWISPAKSSSKDSIAQNTDIDFNLSIYAPMRVDVNQLKFENVSFDNTEIIRQIKNLLVERDAENVSRIELAFTFQNYTPFDMSPQIYLYKAGKLIDSLMILDDGNTPIIEGSPIDYNGFMVTSSTPPNQTILINIDKTRWDKLNTADASVMAMFVNSVKSAKVPYVFLKNDQYVRGQLKIKKLVFSVKAL